MPVAVVTDSSGMLPQEHEGIVVVPLGVVIDEVVRDEGSEGATPADVVAALAARRIVKTSRATPAVLAETYRRLAREGATAIVSLHLSSELSGTVESARAAARDAPVPVEVVDTRAVGPCVGFAAQAAAAVATAGGTAPEAAAAAMARADAARSFFYVDTLEHLRRGGRISSGAALLGSAFAVKPILAIADGKVAAHERVRTSARALARLEALALEAVESVESVRPVGEESVEICVAHLGAEERAATLAATLQAEVPGALVRCGEIGAALGAHVGPGLVAVCVAPAL